MRWALPVWQLDRAGTEAPLVRWLVRVVSPRRYHGNAAPRPPWLTSITAVDA